MCKVLFIIVIKEYFPNLKYKSILIYNSKNVRRQFNNKYCYFKKINNFFYYKKIFEY